MDAATERQAIPQKRTPTIYEKRIVHWVNTSPADLQEGRQKVAKAIEEDFDRLGSLTTYATEVLDLTSSNRAYIEQQPAKGKTGKPHPKNPYVVTQFFKKGDWWVAREVKRISDKKPQIMAEARISSKGETYLTLSYPNDEHNVSNLSNPAIYGARNLPRGCAALFNTLVDYTKPPAPAGLRKLLGRK